MSPPSPTAAGETYLWINVVLGPSNQGGPPLPWLLLQDLQQQVTEGLGQCAVACGRQVEVVKHVLRADGAVRVNKLPAHVQELSPAQPRQRVAQNLVNRRVFLPQGVGSLPSRQQTLSQDKYV